MKRLKLHIVLLLAVTGVISSCIDKESVVTSTPAERTLLYYLTADEASVKERIDSLSACWRYPQGHLLIYRDTGEGDALLEEVVCENGKNRLETVENYGKANSASTILFKQVISRVHGLYPTKDFGLVVYAGAIRGWLPEEITATSRSVITDGRETLSITDFANALPDGLCSFILFEDGYMASLEAAYELKGKTDYVVASPCEVSAQGFLPVYRRVLNCLMESSAGVKGAAEAYYNCDRMESTVAVSVINPSTLEPARHVLQDMEKRVEHWEYVIRDGVQVMDRFTPYALYYDAVSYVAANGTQAEADAFRQAISASVKYSACSGDFPFGTPCGLTLYVPDGHYPKLERERRELRLYQ